MYKGLSSFSIIVSFIKKIENNIVILFIKEIPI